MPPAVVNADNPRLGQDIFEARLTDALLERGLVSTEGLQEALRQQVLLGGHLATNLWELRLVEGKELTQVSAELLNVPIADPKDVSGASPEVRRLFGRDFIEQLRVLPVRVVGSILQVATAEPWDLLTLGRAAYHCGYPVEPFFIAEVPLAALMEKIYGIPTTARFWFGVQTNELRAQKAARGEVETEPEMAARRSALMSYVSTEVAKLRKRRRPGERVAIDVAPAGAAGGERGAGVFDVGPGAARPLDESRGELTPVPRPAAPGGEAEEPWREIREVAALGEGARPRGEIDAGEGPRLPAAWAESASAEAPGETRADDGAGEPAREAAVIPGTGIAPDDAIAAASQAARAARTAPASVLAPVHAAPEGERLIVQPLSGALVAAVEAPPEPITELAEANAALDAARDRDEVGRVLLRFALSRGKRVIVLVRRALLWAGWMGGGEGVDVAHLHSLLMPTAPGTIFGLVAATGAHYLGPLAPHPAYAPFLAALGGSRPRTAALLPVHSHGRLVFGVYLDAGPQKRVTADIGDLVVLAQRVPAALERLIQARAGKKS